LNTNQIYVLAGKPVTQSIFVLDAPALR